MSDCTAASVDATGAAFVTSLRRELFLATVFSRSIEWMSLFDGHAPSRDMREQA
jgi:hypothetical protein